MWNLSIKIIYPIAFALGIASHLLFHPSETFYASALLLCLRMTTYALFPFLIGSIITGVVKILETRKMSPLLLRNLGFIVAGNFFFSFLGGISTFLYTPTKVKTSQQISSLNIPFSWPDFLAQIFPENSLELLIQAHKNFFSFYIFLVLVGFSLYLTRDKVIVFKEFLNSFSRVFYRMNAYVVDLSFFSFFFLMGSFLSQLDVLFSLSSFFPLVLYWLVGTLVIVFGLMPILMHYFFGIKNAHKLLWNFRKTLIYSFLSQDRVGSLAFLIRESRENCLVPRYLSSFQAPLYALFFRGGNAFITVIAFVALIKSYSSLSIGLDQILSLCFFVFLSSFFLLEGKGILLLGLGWLGVYYGNNMDQAHLNLLPIVMLMGGFSTFLDTLVNAYCLVGVSHSLNLKSHYLA